MRLFAEIAGAAAAVGTLPERVDDVDVVATHDFVAESPRELSFADGDRCVTMVTKAAQLRCWWQ